jgi:hypothetical protein
MNPWWIFARACCRTGDGFLSGEIDLLNQDSERGRGRLAQCCQFNPQPDAFWLLGHREPLIN